MSSEGILSQLLKKEIDLAYCETRLQEWEGELTASGSQGMEERIGLAKASSVQALHRMLEMNRMVVDFLASYERQSKKWMTEFLQQRDQHQARMNEFSGSRIMTPLRESLIHYYEDALEVVNRQIDAESEAYQRVMTGYSLCLEGFRRILLDMIFHPDPRSFGYEAIIGSLSRLRSVALPTLDEFGKFGMVLPPVEEKTFANPGGKMQLYLQQYRDAITQWDRLGSAFIQIVNNG